MKNFLIRHNGTKIERLLHWAGRAVGLGESKGFSLDEFLQREKTRLSQRVARYPRSVGFFCPTMFPDYKVVFKPHPHEDAELVQGVASEFLANPAFELNLKGSDYMALYAQSDLMISDLSNTAFTFAMSTLKPVIFFSPNESQIEEALPDQREYLAERTSIGNVISGVGELCSAINYALSSKDQSQKMRDYRNQRVFNVGKSEYRFVEEFQNFLTGKEVAEAVTLTLSRTSAIYDPFCLLEK